MSREKMTVLSPTELLGDRLAEEPLPSDSLGSEGEKSRRLAETATPDSGTTQTRVWMPFMSCLYLEPSGANTCQGHCHPLCCLRSGASGGDPEASHRVPVILLLCGRGST